VLVKVRSVVTVPISELVVAEEVVDTIDGVTAEIVLVVRADVIAVVVAILRDSNRRGSVHFESVIGRIREPCCCGGNHTNMDQCGRECREPGFGIL
jgi:hypothetical protein